MKGAKVGLLATEGHRDVIEMREGLKDDRYNLRMPPPKQLVPRHLRLGVRERMRADGRVETPLDRAKADTLNAYLAIAGEASSIDAQFAAIKGGPRFTGAALCPCRPGEAAALEQLQAFCDGGVGAGGAGGRGIPLFAYEPGRNLPAEAGTSGLSAALKFGTLSPRQAWAAAQQAREVAAALGGAEEALASIGVWEQELAWREFYQQALFHFPELADGPYRPHWRHFPWENHQGRYEAWCEGLTGMPIIDAAMRQLNASGWMHNRCRMIVASYLVKDLICDWRWGETAFMQRLVDGDLAANNGGWQWSASSGMDPKPLRIFNPATQAAKFDSKAAYIRHWLPELRHVSNADLISGEIAPLERRGYPAPVVSHKQQQARFKALYAALPKG